MFSAPHRLLYTRARTQREEEEEREKHVSCVLDSLTHTHRQTHKDTDRHTNAHRRTQTHTHTRAHAHTHTLTGTITSIDSCIHAVWLSRTLFTVKRKNAKRMKVALIQLINAQPCLSIQLVIKLY